MGKSPEAEISLSAFVYIFYIYHRDISERTVRTNELTQAPDSRNFIYKLFQLDLSFNLRRYTFE